ncbi:hypothetical protein BDV32DRAFT_112854 [Aspergillus pseudonomiae]|nr:hypothetical protein BDV32DRAFT_112854 [Aspergillus pseudonomiae]
MSNPLSLADYNFLLDLIIIFFFLFPSLLVSYLPDVLPISMDSMVFSIRTGHCIFTLLFVLSLHFSALPMFLDGGSVRSHGLC